MHLPTETTVKLYPPSNRCGVLGRSKGMAFHTWGLPVSFPKQFIEIVYGISWVNFVLKFQGSAMAGIKGKSLYHQLTKSTDTHICRYKEWERTIMNGCAS